MKNITFLFLFMAFALTFTACLEDSGELTDTANTEAATLTVDPGGTVIRGVTDEIMFPVSLTAMSDPGLVQSVDVILDFNGVAKTVEDLKVATLTSLPAEVSFTTAELLSQAGLTLDDLNAGDSWTYAYQLNNTAGATWQVLNQTRFTFTCQSELAGMYSAVAEGASTDICCPDPVSGYTSTVELTEVRPGVYDVNDITGGIYFEWYEAYGLNGPEDSPGRLEHICGEVNIIETTEPFGTAVSGEGTYNDATGVITYSWTNGFGDTGTVVLTPL